jgi:outer membrane protein assembly factor BamA
VKPVSFAFRAMHYGRYFGDADSSILSPLTIGMDYLVRGYSFWTFNPNELHYDANGNAIELDRLYGSKIGVVNFEIRFPLTGPREIAPIKSLHCPQRSALFFDGGIAWSGSQKPEITGHEHLESCSSIQHGLSLRVNIFGYLVMEGYYAIPFQRPEHIGLTKGVFGLVLYPGW